MESRVQYCSRVPPLTQGIENKNLGRRSARSRSILGLNRCAIDQTHHFATEGN